jgi:succinoglycan biosynthesis protein ExoA
MNKVLTPEPTRRPAVTVMVPCRNEAGHIESCIRSLFAQRQPEGGFEVVVADGLSDDGTRDILKQLENEFNCEGSTRDGNPADRENPSGVSFRVIDNPGRTAAKGLNAAIRSAEGQILIRVDAHTEYAPDYLQECVSTLHKTNADNVGGPARTKAITFLERAIAAAYHSPFSVGGASFHNISFEGPVDTVTYGCWRRELFSRVGYFDEELIRNQDDEHNLRIIRSGGRVWQNPKIKSWYRPRGSFKTLFEQYMQYGYWKVRVIQKHKLPASWRHLVPGAFLLLLLVLSAASILSVLAPPLHSIFKLFPAGLLLVASLYAFALSVASIFTAAKNEWRLLPVLPLVFPCFHFGYGWGFLRGAWDFLLWQRTPGSGFQTLTR